MIHFEGYYMYQRKADPEVQMEWFVRRRPIFVSESTMQTTKRWVNAECSLIRELAIFFDKSLKEKLVLLEDVPGQN